MGVTYLSSPYSKFANVMKYDSTILRAMCVACPCYNKHLFSAYALYIKFKQLYVLLLLKNDEFKHNPLYILLQIG